MTMDPSGSMDEAMEEAREAAAGGATERLLERIADRFGARASVQAVFGTPIERGDVTVIPVARVRWGFGGGAGTGTGPAEDAGSGSGSGVGGAVAADAVGYLEVGADGASFRPIAAAYPSPLFLLAGSVSAAIIIRALARLIRG